MALRKAHLIGGPYDGGVLPAASRQPYIWVKRTTSRHGNKLREEVKGYTRPAKGRQLYRSIRCEQEIEQFLYAGHTHRRCDDCGTYVELTAVEGKPRESKCFCGSDVSKQAA